MTEPRITIHIPVHRSGVKAIDSLADTEQRSRSQMVRILLAEALKARAGSRANSTTIINAPNYQGSQADLKRTLEDLNRRGQLPRR